MAQKTSIRIRGLLGIIPIGILAVLFSSLVELSGASLVKPDSSLWRSFSGQFVVRSANVAKSGTVTNEDLVYLEPNLVTVSCERIKQLLFRELDAGNNWQGKIYIALVASDTPHASTTIVSERFRNSWQYRVELPNFIERARYVRTIVHALLLEIANRSDGGHAAEIPVWFSEGLAQYFLAGNELEIILPPPRAANNGFKVNSTDIRARKISPAQIAYSKLKNRSPLSFAELSWPPEDPWSTETAEVYRSTSQLFVHQLLQLKEGRTCLRTFLSQLCQRLNWQLAFLDGFQPYFSKPLDIEKWWALQIVHLGRRDISQHTWSFEESQSKLDEALHASMQIHTGQDDLPLHTTVSLSAVIRDSKNPASLLVLQDKVRELQNLRLRIAPEFAGLLDKYSHVLTACVQREDNASERETKETVAQLEELDALRVQVRPRQKAVAVRQP